MSTQGSIFPCVASPQFQSQICCSHVESGPGDHKFKGEFGFAQTKPSAELNIGSLATQIIITLYIRPKSALTADVLSNVVMQLCSHTAVVVVQSANPLARAQFFLQASSNVATGVPVAPPAADPPVAEAPPAVVVPPVAEVLPVLPPVAAVVPPGVGTVWFSLLLQEQTQEATPNTKTNGPTLFLNMLSLTETKVSRSRRSSQ
jgi:hypothetical protein